MKNKKKSHQWECLDELGSTFMWCPLCRKVEYIPTGERMTYEQAMNDPRRVPQPYLTNNQEATQ